MDDGSPFTGARVGGGRRRAPDAVWAAARQDYLSGLSGREVCARHGLRLGTLKQRSAAEGWRRKDQPPPPSPEPFDEGFALEAAVDGDLDRIEYRDLARVAHRRMMRAILRGGAVEALRWRRVADLMDADQIEVDEWDAAPESPAEATRAAGLGPTDPTDLTDSSDLIFADDGEDPPIFFRRIRAS